jgi:glycosyltransferase involved in cell wall biosynthesis
VKLLFVCADRADDPLLWSGVVSNCRQALLDAGVELAIFDRIPFECSLGMRIRHQLLKAFERKTHLLQLEPSILQRAARRVIARYAEGDCDGVFCPGTGVPIYACLPTNIPVFTYMDATKRSWIKSYFGMETLCGRSRRKVDLIDRLSLFNNTRSIFASDWARAEAIRDYNVPPERTAIVPFGANLSDPPTRAEVEGWIEARPRDRLNLFFLGKEWERKGGPDALALVHALRQRGIPATLDIVGCQPRLAPAELELTRMHGFIDHSTPAGREKFRTLLRQAHVLVFLSHAEAFGIALCEAAAFGVPAFAAASGGIPTIVQDGVTGWLTNLPFSPEVAATTIARFWKSPAEYRFIALAARADYESRLNWKLSGRKLKAVVEEALAQRAASPSL